MKILTNIILQIVKIIDAKNMTLPVVGGFVVTVAMARDNKRITSKEGTISNVIHIGIISSQISITDTPKIKDYESRQ